MKVKQYKPNDEARIEAMLFTEQSAADAQKWTENKVFQLGSFGGWAISRGGGFATLPLGSYLVKDDVFGLYPIDPEVFEKRWMEV